MQKGIESSEFETTSKSHTSKTTRRETISEMKFETTSKSHTSKTGSEKGKLRPNF